MSASCDDGDDDAPITGFRKLAAMGIINAPGTAAREEAEAGRSLIRYTARPAGNVIQLPRAAGDPQPKPAAAHVAPWVVDPSTLEGVRIPEREWIVKDWLPVGYASLLYGEGGTAKTLLMQQLMTAAATGTDWLGMAVERCRSYALFCEDDEAEMFTRQAAINTRIGASFADLGDMRWTCPIGSDNTLIRFSRSGEPAPTDRFKWFRDQVISFGARIVLIDTAAQTFGGSEIDRAQVTAFVGQILTSLAQDINGAVLLAAHPSQTGKSSGAGTSGSTGWSASCRNRWYLQRPPTVEGGADDPNARTLTRLKSNGAAAGETIALRWKDWFLDREGAPAEGGAAGAFASVNRQFDAEALFLTLLARCWAANMPVQMSKNASTYAPKVFVKRPDAEGYTVRELDAAMHRLLAARRIVLLSYGRPGDERRRLALAPDAPGDASEGEATDTPEGSAADPE